MSASHVKKKLKNAVALFSGIPIYLNLVAIACKFYGGFGGNRKTLIWPRFKRQIDRKKSSIFLKALLCR